MRRGGLLLMCAIGAGCGQLLGVDELHDRDASIDANDAASDASAPEVCAPQYGPCSTFPLCGCDTDQNCEITSNGTGLTACTPGGSTPKWWPCKGPGDCQRGMTCVGEVCKPYCDTAADCVGTHVTCELVRDDSNGKIIPGFKVCSAGCDLLDPSTVCGPDVTCYPYPWDGGECHGDCSGTSGDASTCSGTNATPHTECSLGYYCLADTSCKKWCRVGHSSSDCPDGGLCIGFTPPPVWIGKDTYGLCP